MSSARYWIAIGDIHDDPGRLDEIPELQGASGIIVTGDITVNGGIKQAAKALEKIAAKTPLLLAQIGNMDQGEITRWLDEKGWNLHGEAREIFPGVMAVGVGGSNFSPFATPSEFSEGELAQCMEKGVAKAGQASRLVLISHAPPYNTACDRLTGGTAVGSPAVREFIEKHQPDCCICGHIHESRARDRLGATTVINPGPLSRGGYAILSQPGPDGPVQAELKILAQNHHHSG